MKLSALNRQLLFIIGCIPSRLLLLALVIYFNTNPTQIINHSRLYYMHKFNVKNVIAIICILIGIGFMMTFISNKQIGFFGGNTWWSHLRLIHSINFIAFGVYSLQGFSWAPIILLFDIIVGLIGFGINYLL